jgi:glycosyltransferase involved in cell wall biosynthesis
MRVLVVSRNFPSEPAVQVHGVYRRLNTLVRAVASTGAEVRLLFFVDDAAQYESDIVVWQERMQAYFSVPVALSFASLEPYQLASRGFRGLIAGIFSWAKQGLFVRYAGVAQQAAVRKALVDGVECILVHRVPWMVPVFRIGGGLPPVFLDMDDIEHVAFARSIEQPPYWRSKFLLYLHLPALILAERAAVKLAQKTFVCSALDVSKLSVIAANGRVVQVANSVPFPRLTAPGSAPTLLFLGTFEYLPNVHAVEFMLDAVWPLVRLAVPDARLVIGGNKPEHVRHFVAPPAGVEFAGFIPNLDDAYAQARAVVCPVLSGGGTRVKIVEAASYGRAVVSTVVGAEGLVFSDGAEIFLADSPAQFADHCVALLRSEELATRVGLAARERACLEYDEQSVIKRVGSWLLEAMR